MWSSDRLPGRPKVFIWRKTQLSELEPGAGYEPETRRPTCWSARWAARGRSGFASTSLARAADDLGHPDPLDTEGGVGLPENGAPEGVVAGVNRPCCACSSARAGTLHPAITSFPGESPNEAQPRLRTPR